MLYYLGNWKGVGIPPFSDYEPNKNTFHLLRLYPRHLTVSLGLLNPLFSPIPFRSLNKHEVDTGRDIVYG